MGASSPRKRNRRYTAAEKAEFFRRLAVTPNVSAVARVLGFVRVTCYKWAHQAGIFTGKDANAQREEFLGLRAEGLSRAQAAAPPASTSSSVTRQARGNAGRTKT